jgi:hypothetical protein
MRQSTTGGNRLAPERSYVMLTMQRRKGSRPLEHDAKKWEPVFRLNHAKTKTPIA